MWEGEEILLKHPGENYMVKKITGISMYDDDAKLLQISHKRFWICLSCGEGDYYESSPAKCMACNSNSVSFPYNKPVSAAIMDETEKYSARCPFCREGLLSTKMVGLS